MWFFDNTRAIQSVEPLTLVSLGLPNILLAVGLAIAGTVFVVEIAGYKRKQENTVRTFALYPTLYA